jgi:hypothetical protein
VVHFAVISNHIHFILEPGQARLGRLIQSLCISFAKQVNSELTRKGSVFLDRYHLHPLKTPTEVRNALAYVLTNEHHHRSTRTDEVQVRIDPFSSAWAFKDWKKLGLRAQFEFSSWSESAIEAWYDEILQPARTWLLTLGWMRAR